MDKLKQLERRVEELERQNLSRQGFNTFGYEETMAIKSLFPNILFGSATIDFGSITTGNSASATIPVGGARLGDVVVVGFPTGVVEASRILHAFVSSADTVTLYISNETSGTIDPDSGVYTAAVIQKSI